MGGLTTSEQKTETSSQTDPWAPQAGALTTAFDAATGAYKNVAANGPKAPTDFTAQMTPEQLSTFRTMIMQGGDFTIPDQVAGTGSALQNAGMSGVGGALTGLRDYNPSATNNADSVVANARRYMEGQDIPGAVRAAMQSATETARDVTMPGIEQHAATSGNTNNTRTGVAQGIVQRSLGNQAMGLSATLGNKAWSDGLALAEKQASSNNEGVLRALGAEGSIGNTAANGGVSAAGQSLAGQGVLNSTAMAGGAGLQASQQAYLDNWLKKYQSGTSAPFDAIKQLMGVIGTNNWGSSTNGTSTTETTASPIQAIGGLMTAAGSLIPGGGGSSAPSWSSNSGNGAGGYAFPMY